MNGAALHDRKQSKEMTKTPTAPKLDMEQIQNCTKEGESWVDLKATTGKNFHHANTKKKKSGSYHGGTIPTDFGINFEDNCSG